MPDTLVASNDATDTTVDSPFVQFLRANAQKRTYLEPMAGNNGDGLILRGAQHLLAKLDIPVVERPEDAEQIFVNGGGAMNDIGRFGIDVLRDLRTRFPNTTCFVGPSTYRFHGIDFRSVCDIGSAPLTFFSRDTRSDEILAELSLPKHCHQFISRDIALELYDSELIADAKASRAEKHVLIAMRKDLEGSASGMVQKLKCKWLPRSVRKPLSKVRDRWAAKGDADAIEQILEAENVDKSLPRIYRDVSVSLTFEEFVRHIAEATLVVTDRLHVGILSTMMEKRTILRPGVYHKVRGVYELSLSGPGSRTTLWDPNPDA